MVALEGTIVLDGSTSEMYTREVVESFLPGKKLRTNGKFENRLDGPENKNLRKRVWVRG